jgi:hypothetical protein
MPSVSNFTLSSIVVPLWTVTSASAVNEAPP